jgi:hypothetical protein
MTADEPGDGEADELNADTPPDSAEQPGDPPDGQGTPPREPSDSRDEPAPGGPPNQGQPPQGNQPRANTPQDPEESPPGGRNPQAGDPQGGQPPQGGPGQPNQAGGPGQPNQAGGPGQPNQAGGPGQPRNQPAGQGGGQGADQPAGQPRARGAGQPQPTGQQPRGHGSQPVGGVAPAPDQPGATAQSDGISFEQLPWVAGSLQGAGYALSSYIVISLVFLGDIFASAPDAFSPSADALIYGVSWWFYHVHFVDVSDAFFPPDDLLNIPEFGYLLIAGFFLFLAGRATARSHGTLDDSNAQLAVYGAVAGLGYVILPLIGAFLLTKNGESPDIVTTIIFMGVIWPAIFAGLGGYLSKR